MKKIGGRIGVLMGGASAEREVSLRSGDGVAQALESLGHEVVRIVLDRPETFAEAIVKARIDVAFLEFMTPGLPETLAAAAAAGAGRVAIAPLFWAEGGHLKREVPALIAECAARHPSLAIERWPVLGDSAEVLDALAAVYVGRWARA